MRPRDKYVLEIEWDRPSPDSPILPPLVGPFSTRGGAHRWAERNIPDGSWMVAPLTHPDYARSAS